jgi:hypothetical protein
MTNQHPITPPLEVMLKLRSQFHNGETLEATWTLAFQAGADQELEACCDWTSKYLPYLGDFPLPEDKLRAARRPKPPSLKEQALEELENMVKAAKDFGFGGTDPTAIRRVLEQLDD